MRAPDWIHLLEASYELGEDDAGWRRHLLASAAPLFEGHRDLVMFVANVSCDRVVLEACEVIGPADARQGAITVNDAGPPDAIDFVYRSGAVVGSLSDLVFSRLPEAQALFVSSSGGRVCDAICLVGRAGPGRVALLLSPRKETTSPSARERRHWHQAMSHVSAGLRLRRLMAAAGTDLVPEAILDSSGHIHDASGPASSTSARESLRAAVQRIERARTRLGRSQPEQAMESWRALVDGRWSLVDRFDSDGKRFVVALKNDQDILDPRGLSDREEQVAERIGLGRSTKEIAYELGLSLSAVSMAVGSARRKLGFDSRTELASFFSPNGMRVRLSETALAGEPMLVGAQPLIDEAIAAVLSPAEHEVAKALLAGSTSADVAARRGTSERTVANQIASIFSKLGVNSRIELAARLRAPNTSSERLSAQAP